MAFTTFKYSVSNSRFEMTAPLQVSGELYVNTSGMFTEDVLGDEFGSINALSGQFYTHAGDTSNSHEVTFDQARDEQGGSDVTLTELETLSDGSDADALHFHPQYAPSGQYVGLSGDFTTHRDDTSNPHEVTFAQGVSQEGGSDVSLSELEELTDGSQTTLHTHAGGGLDTLDTVCDRGAETDQDIHTSGTLTADVDLKAGEMYILTTMLVQVIRHCISISSRIEGGDPG